MSQPSPALLNVRPKDEAAYTLGLSLESSLSSGSTDAAWFSFADADVDPVPWFTYDVNSDNEMLFRKQIGTVGRDEQNIGDWVCAYGTTIQDDCGFITSKDYCPYTHVTNCNDIFIHIDTLEPQGDHAPGSSGGAVYLGGNAYGVISGYERNDLGLDSIRPLIL